MSDEFDTEDQGEGIKGLRKQYEALKAERDAQAKELAAFKAAQRQSSVAEVLKAKGLPATAAKLYNGDDTSEEAVGKWLEEFADVFGGTSAGSAEDSNAADAQRVSAASGGASSGTAVEAGGNSIIGDPAEMLHLMQTLPYEELQKRGYMPPSGTLFSR